MYAAYNVWMCDSSMIMLVSDFSKTQSLKKRLKDVNIFSRLL